MRSSTLLIAFLTAIALSGSANAAPITRADLQRQPSGIAVEIVPYSDQLINNPILLSRDNSATKSLTDPSHIPAYLPGGPDTREILPSTAASLPEPPSILLLGTGILGIAAICRYRRVKA